MQSVVQIKMLTHVSHFLQVALFDEESNQEVASIDNWMGMKPFTTGLTLYVKAIGPNRDRSNF